jgi:starch phosphorylase
VEQVMELRRTGYQPKEYYHNNDSLRAAMDLISCGHFSSGDRELFKPIIDSLLDHDPYMLLADYQDYISCQDRVSRLFEDKKSWTKKSILNTARMGKFSSDRSYRAGFA